MVSTHHYIEHDNHDGAQRLDAGLPEGVHDDLAFRNLSKVCLPRLQQARVRAEAQGGSNHGMHQDDVALAHLLRAALEKAVQQGLAVQDGAAGVDVLEE